jgi:hypothetical protein
MEITTVKKIIAMSTLSCTIAVLTGCGGSDAPSITPEWETTVGPTHTVEDAAEGQRTINVDSYGDIITAGDTVVYGPGVPQNSNALITKHDESGYLLWSKEFDFSDNEVPAQEQLRATATDIDGNIYVTGQTDIHSEGASFLLKLDRFGNEIWSNILEAHTSDRNIKLANGLVYTNGYYAMQVHDTAGNFQLRIDHADANGNQKFDYQIRDFDVDSQGNIYTASEDLIHKYDANGQQQWIITRTYGEFASWTSMAVDDTGNTYVVNLSRDNTYIVQVMKIDEDGNTTWIKNVTNRNQDSSLVGRKPFLALDSENNPIIVASGDGGREITKLDTNGNQLWVNKDKGNAIAQIIVDEANNVYIYGQGLGEKIGSDGQSIAKTTPPSLNIYPFYTSGGIAISGNNIYVADSVNNGDKSWDFYIAKYINLQ